MWARYSTPNQTGPGAHPASCKMGTGSFPGVKSGRGVTLTTHPLLVPWSRKGRAIPLLPLWAVWPVQSLSALCLYIKGKDSSGGHCGAEKKKVPQNISLRSCLKALVFREMFHSQISLEANEQALLPCETTAPHTNRLHGGVISFENGMANTPLEFYATYRPTAIFTHIQAASPCLNEIKPTDILRH